MLHEHDFDIIFKPENLDKELHVLYSGGKVDFDILDIYIKPIPVRQYTIKVKIVSVTKGELKIHKEDFE